MTSELPRQLSRLAAAMRREGARVGLGELLTAHRALAVVDASDRRLAHHALRAALCSGREDLAIFDAAFEEVFGSPRHEQPVTAQTVSAAAGELETPADAGGRDRGAAVPSGWSDAERLRHADFADLGPEDLARVSALVAALARRGPRRSSRRLRPHHHRHASVDVRATIRDSLRYGGEPLRRRWRGPSERPRRLVAVCDVSGSMRPYAEGLLRYVHALVAARSGVEAFVFGTRLTRVTPELRTRSPERALARLGAVVEDWAGGTRIGESLRTLNTEHGGRVGRGATVVVLSDGWDRGATDELSAELARLARTAHRLIWLNPLKARPGYEPLAKGMEAALPHLDVFLAGNSLAGLEELAVLLEAGLG
jgi:hypothetical protein